MFRLLLVSTVVVCGFSAGGGLNLLKLEVGQKGEISAQANATVGGDPVLKIVRIVNDNSLIAKWAKNEYFVDIPTKGKVDNQELRLKGVFEVSETRKNGSQTLFVLRPVKDDPAKEEKKLVEAVVAKLDQLDPAKLEQGQIGTLPKDVPYMVGKTESDGAWISAKVQKGKGFSNYSFFLLSPIAAKQGKLGMKVALLETYEVKGTRKDQGKVIAIDSSNAKAGSVVVKPQERPVLIPIVTKKK